MIKLFDCKDTVFNTSNGDKIIEATKCNVIKGDIAKGEYYVDFETSIKYSDILVQDKIIVVPTPTGEQPFRLNNPQKKSDKLVFKANHIFYDTKGYVVEDAYPKNMGCQGALNWVIEKTDVENPFVAYSDLVDVKNARYVNKSLFDVICMMVKEWGGYLDVDGLTIKIISSIGEDRGVTIRYGKNLTNITAKEDWNNVCTKLFAVGYGGVELDEPLVSDIKYGRPYSKTVEFQPGADVDLSDSNSIKNDLEVQAAAYLEMNQYPKVTYTIKSHINNVVDIGDTIQVIHEMLNINILTEVISYTYNSNTHRFSQITIGNYFQDLKRIFADINQKVDQIEKVVSQSYKALEKGLEESKQLINQYLMYGYRYSTESAEYYLNAKTPEEATQFMIISLGGIGFGTKENGAPITEAEYNTAWTLDGKFNTSFITANSIVSNQLNINEIFSNSAVLNKIVSQEIFTDAIETNKLIVGASENASKALQEVNKTVKSITMHYLATTLASGVTISTSGWTTTVQQIDATKKYLWTYQTITYVDDTTTDTSPVISGVYGNEGKDGKDGEDGTNGVGITSVVPLYYLESNTTAPSAPTSAVTSTAVSSGVWTKSIPTYVANYTYFTCTQTQYTNGTYTWSTVVSDNALTNANAVANMAKINADTAINRATYHYGACVTAAATAAKVVALTGFALYTGAQVTVQFTYANTAANPTLNVNGTGAKYIRVNNANITAPYYWGANNTVTFTYNGTYWVMSDTCANSIVANWASTNDRTYIDGGKIYAKSVTADKMNVEDLSALNATLGGWTINSAGIRKMFPQTTIISYGKNINANYNGNYLIISEATRQVFGLISTEFDYWGVRFENGTQDDGIGIEYGARGISVAPSKDALSNEAYELVLGFSEGNVWAKKLSADAIACNGDAYIQNVYGGTVKGGKVITTSGVDLDKINSNLNGRLQLFSSGYASSLTIRTIPDGIYFIIIQESISTTNRSKPSFGVIYINGGNAWINVPSSSDSKLSSITCNSGSLTITLSASRYITVTLFNTMVS